MTDDSNAFPLSDWFDVTRRISSESRKLAEKQIALYGLKDGKDDPFDAEWQRAVSRLRNAVRAHNKTFS